MGEIAEMMLEGDLCEACGSALSGEGYSCWRNTQYYGIPRYCSNECARDRGFDGIQSDGAGTYFKKKKVKQPPQNLLSIRITFDGRSVLPDGQKNIKITDLSFEQAKTLAGLIQAVIKENG